MKILVNASNLSSAGGLTVALNFLDHVLHRSEHEFYFLAPPQCGYEKYTATGMKGFFLSKWQMKYWGRMIYDHFIAPSLIRKIKPDVIFTMGNFAIPVKGYKQVLLFAWPYPLYPESEVWKMFSARQKIVQNLRLKIFNDRLKYADIVVPQTDVAKNRLKLYYPQLKEIRVVPNSYSLISSAESLHDFSVITSDKKNLLCLTRYYLHKNVEVLLKVAAIFKQKKLPFRFILTMGEDQHANVKEMNEYVKNNMLEEYVVNLGPILVTAVRSLYGHCHGLILPTLLESFSGTYIDSMYFGKPVFTSDLDFARYACGDAAFYFNPHEPEEIAKVIEQAFLNPEKLEDKIDKGRAIVQSMPNWQKVADAYMEILTDEL